MGDKHKVAGAPAAPAATKDEAGATKPDTEPAPSPPQTVGKYCEPPIDILLFRNLIRLYQISYLFF